MHTCLQGQSVLVVVAVVPSVLRHQSFRQYKISLVLEDLHYEPIMERSGLSFEMSSRRRFLRYLNENGYQYQAVAVTKRGKKVLLVKTSTSCVHD